MPRLLRHLGREQQPRVRRRHHDVILRAGQPRLFDHHGAVVRRRRDSRTGGRGRIPSSRRSRRRRAARTIRAATSRCTPPQARRRASRVRTAAARGSAPYASPAAASRAARRGPAAGRRSPAARAGSRGRQDCARRSAAARPAVRAREVDQPAHVIAHRADEGRIGERQRAQRAVRLEPALDHRQLRGPTSTGRGPGSSGPATPNSFAASIYNAPRVDLFSRQTGDEGDAMLSRRAFLERGSSGIGGHEPAHGACGRGAEPVRWASRSDCSSTRCATRPRRTCRERCARSPTSAIARSSSPAFPPISATEPAQDPERPRPDGAEHAREHGGFTDGAAAAHRLREGARRRIPRLLVPVDGGLALPRQSGPRGRVARVRHHARRLEVERRAAQQDRRSGRARPGCAAAITTTTWSFARTTASSRTTSCCA